MLKVLVACEESQRVASEFRKLGHEAYSCDIVDCSGGHPEWHIKEDVLPLLGGGIFKTCDGNEHVVDRWDCIIAFPPCTHLALSGATYFEKKRKDGRQREGIEFFCKFLEADCDHIAIENPMGIIGGGNYIKGHYPDLAARYSLPRPYSQTIQPWMFGDNHRKTTCLWLKGLPELITDVNEEPELEFFEWIDGKTGKKKKQPKWYYEALTKSKTPEERATLRSKTFPGVAKAMAEQWSKYLEEN